MDGEVARTAKKSLRGKNIKRFLYESLILLRNIMSNWSFNIGIIITLVMLLTALSAPYIAPKHYSERDLKNRLKHPSLEHWFGTDEFGRDIFSRVVYGARIAFWVGFVVVFAEGLIGVSLGLLAGYYGGGLDKLISALSDLIWSLPPTVLALGVVTVLGPGLTEVVIAIAIVSWPPFSRISRAKTQSIKSMDFVLAAGAIGENNFNIITRYILPNIAPSIIVLSTLTLPSAILSTTALSFLGFGAQPPTPDWGAMVSRGMIYLNKAPWITTYPGVFLVLLSLGLNLLGDGLRDILDPRLKI